MNSTEQTSSYFTKQYIVKLTRIIDICAYLLSAISLIVSMVMFRVIPALRNHRTTIHMLFFGTTITHVIVQLIFYTDQALFNGFDKSLTSLGSMEEYNGINNTPYVCEALHFIQEYSISMMFVWILLDGIYICRCFTSNILRLTFPLIRYATISCLFPLLNVAIWAAATGVHYAKEDNVNCWFGYNYNSLYWILQGPRLFLTMIITLVIIHIVRNLLPKLRNTRKNGTGNIMKTIISTCRILAFLACTTTCSMIEFETWTTWIFAVWILSTHFLRSTQGFMLAVSYCFTNCEVQEAVKRMFNSVPQEQPEIPLQQTTAAIIYDPLHAYTVKERQEISSSRMLRKFQELHDQRENFDQVPETIETRV